MGSIKEYWKTWLWSDIATRIITVNTIVWIVIGAGLLFIPSYAHDWWIGLFGMPASIFQLPARIWTVATYMVSQYDFLHLLVNMLWLLLFGRMLDHFSSSKDVVAVYVIGGLAGAAAFLVANIVRLGYSSLIIGSSCSVLSVVGACLCLCPQIRVNLLLFGEVKVLWIGLAAVVIYIVMQPTIYVSFAHAAGLVAGAVYGYKLRGASFGSLWRKTHNAAAESRVSLEQRIDQLLDKVNRSGYASLSTKERQELFDLSRKIKR